MRRGNAVDARQALLSLKDQNPWALKFHDELVRWPAEEKAFTRLIEKGCDPDDLLSELYFCCSGAMSEYLADKREAVRDIAFFGRRLLDNAKQIQRFEASPAKTLVLKTFGRPEFQGLSTRLRTYAQCLIDEATKLKRGLSVREGEGLATASLAARVEGSTGGAHYAELAKVMEAFYSMRGIQKQMSTQAVARRVKRFRRKHGLAYRHMRNMASREFGKRKGEYISGPVTL